MLNPAETTAIDVLLGLRAVRKCDIIICVVDRMVENDLWPTRLVITSTSQTVRGPMNHHCARCIPATRKFFRSRLSRARHPVLHLHELRLG